ncbi:MAG: flagellar hook-basal body complex protein [Planctomycetia bacterium]|nr:flagellar hook-basal body complex protein [Planctomycetia bacterium]
MGLASALSTALTGLTAAETTIDVVGNNVANSNTVGFKASTAIFATQFLQTQGLGSSPTSTNGGTNPRQVGLGVQVAEITPDFTQGTIEISANPSDLAIQGDGFFMVQGTQGETLYSRNGIFKTNSQNELVNINGNRLLGFGVDDNFQILETSLQPLTIPLGASAVAQATQHVFFEGALTPTGDIATQSQVIQTGILGDAQFTAPAAATTTNAAAIPTGTTAAAPNTTGTLANGTYIYRVVFADDTIANLGTESLESSNVSITLAGANDAVDLTGIPNDPNSRFDFKRIYRSTDGGTTFQYLSEVGSAVTTFTDDGSITPAAANATLHNTDTLTGNYSYYVTFFDQFSGRESRPAPLVAPFNVVGGRIQLDDIPNDTSGNWTHRRIYRNLATDSTEFHRVTTIPLSGTVASYTDYMSDVTLAALPEIDLDGPKISANTLLVNVLGRNGSTYANTFQTGTLSFTGSKGGRELATKDFEVTGATTVLDLINFMEQAMGVQDASFDPVNPIPGDANFGAAGGSVTADGRIRMVGNNGVDNAIDVGLSGLQFTTSTGTTNVNLPFGKIQDALGQSAVADFRVYDSLGIPLNVRVTSVLESRDSTSTTYRWFADSGDNDPQSGAQIGVGTGLISFDGEGKVISVSEETVSIARSSVSSVSPLEFDLDFSQLSGLAQENSTLAASRQDGSAAGTLSSFIIGEDGTIRGVFSNGVTRDLGQIRLARFSNPAGLEQKGENLFASGVNSGLAIEGDPGGQGIGSIVAGAVELSNTDIGANLIDLILASTQYRGNTRVITAAQQLLDELLNLRR